MKHYRNTKKYKEMG